MAMIPDLERRWKQFEELGEAEVRKRLAAGIYGEPNLHAAREWLDYKEQQRQLDADADRRSSSADERRIARSAKNAAWIAAIAAIIAAIFAIIAFVFR